jgi:uncharacterized integral membrane protein
MRLLTRLVYSGIILLSCGLIAAFVVVNNTPASVHLWPSDTQITAEIWVFILGAFASGMLVGGLFIWTKLLSLRTRLWARDRQLAKLHASLEKAERKSDDALMLERPDQAQVQT